MGDLLDKLQKNLGREMNKAWAAMTPDDKLDHLVLSAQRHALFGSARPPFDRKFFLACRDFATLDDIRYVLLHIHKRWNSPEGAKEIESYSKLRRHFVWLLKNRVRWNRNAMDMNYPKAAEMARKPIRVVCADCQQSYDPNTGHVCNRKMESS